MSNSVMLLLTDSLIIGLTSALVIGSAIFLGRKEDRERARATRRTIFKEPRLESPGLSSDRRSAVTTRT
jgi:hypothetical protein